MKKMILFIMLIMLATGVGAATDSPLVMVDNETERDSKLYMVSQQPDPAEPGSYVEVRWKVENVGEEKTGDVVFEIEPKYPFTLSKSMEKRQVLGEMDSYQTGEEAYILYYKLKVDEEAVEGPNEIDLRYSTNGGEDWSTAPYHIRVEEQNYLISIDDVETQPEKATPGKPLDLTMTFKNMASSEIKDVTASLDLSEVPFSPKSSVDEKVFGLIRPRDSVEAEFKLSTDASAESKVHKVPVTITYHDRKGKKYTKEFNLGVEVFNEPEYTLNIEDSEIYRSGQKGNIVFSLSNTGSGEIKYLTLDLKDTEDYEIISSEKVYIGNIESDGFDTANFDIYADTEKEQLPVKIGVTYKDNYNQEYSDEKVLNIDLHNREQAVNLGYEKPQNNTNMIFGIITAIILTIFWLFMLIDAIKSGHENYRKVLWIALIILTFAVGALIYYMIGRKKSLG
ncbi:MAG: PLDc N-terminal domain-containing protein [Nanobdellota archaeon]